MQHTYGTNAVRADGGELCRMPVKDEPARRRHGKLVECFESLMRAALKPEYQGYYGQLILSGDDLAEMGKLKDVGVPLGRRDAVSAGRRPLVS